LGDQMHKHHKTACMPNLDARPDLDTQTAAVSSFHNSHSLPQILY